MGVDPIRNHNSPGFRIAMKTFKIQIFVPWLVSMIFKHIYFSETASSYGLDSPKMAKS